MCTDKTKPKCWICGINDATSGEHMTKRSDLRDVYGTPTQKQPLFFHDGKRKNFRVGSLDSAILKFSERICEPCNNARTQFHDQAWAAMSDALRSRQPPVKPGDMLRGNRIFRYDTARHMLNVHLFFAKQFGCIAMQAKAMDNSTNIDVSPLATGILVGSAVPNFFLKFGRAASFAGEPRTGRSNLEVVLDKSDRSLLIAVCRYYIDGITVEMTYAKDDLQHPWLNGAWHPRSGTNKITISDLP